jgi:hypothetical protein
MLITPPRSLNVAPTAASAYGTLMRSARRRTAERPCAHADPPRNALEHLLRRDGEQDHDRLQHLDQLLRHELIRGKTAIRQRAEEQCRDHDTDRMVASEQRDRDAEESGAGREAELEEVLVALNEVASAEPRDRARQAPSP